MNIYFLETEGSMFDSYHLGYIFISLFFTVFFLVIGKKFIKKQKYKDIYLKFWAVLTVFLHLSPLWIAHLKGETAVAVDNMLFPIYFCNLTMYFLMLVSLWGNKETIIFKYLAIIAGYAGVFGALISLFYPDYYLGASSMFEWGVFKSMLSHSTMLIGSLYLFVGNYFKTEFKNSYVFGVGLLFYGFIGIIVNKIFAAADLNPRNAMYLQGPPIPEVPILNAYTIAILMFLLTMLIGFLLNNGLKKSSEKIKYHLMFVKKKT